MNSTGKERNADRVSQSSIDAPSDIADSQLENAENSSLPDDVFDNKDGRSSSVVQSSTSIPDSSAESDEKVQRQRRRESFFAEKNCAVIVPRSAHHQYFRRLKSSTDEEQTRTRSSQMGSQQIMSSKETAGVLPEWNGDEIEQDEEADSAVSADSPIRTDAAWISTKRSSYARRNSLLQAQASRKRISRMEMHGYLEAVLSTLELLDRIYVMVRLETQQINTVRFFVIILRKVEQLLAVEDVMPRRSRSVSSGSEKPAPAAQTSCYNAAKLASDRVRKASDLDRGENQLSSAIVLGIDVITPTNAAGTNGAARPLSDCSDVDNLAANRPYANIGLALPICAETNYRLDGDGGFSITFSTVRNCRYSGNVWSFKPVSIQATFSALSSLKRCCDAARNANVSVHDVSYMTALVTPYDRAIADGDPTLAAEWNRHDETEQTGATAWQFALMTQKLEKRESCLVAEENCPTKEDSIVDLNKLSIDEVRTRVHTALLHAMMPLDFEEVSTKQLRSLVEAELKCSLDSYRGMFEQCVLVVMGQLEKPSRILDGLYLGSEWNASNLDELRRLNVRYVLNCARECDNFYATQLRYMNVRVFDTLDADLLRYWSETHEFIDEAFRNGSACLVHCKMGVSRSASTVMAYCMKDRKWTLKEAFDHVKKCRPMVQPNENFMRQLVTYEGILAASRRRQQLPQSPTSQPSSLFDSAIPKIEVHTSELPDNDQSSQSLVHSS